MSQQHPSDHLEPQPPDYARLPPARLTGMLLILSVVVFFFAQLVALLSWEGIYSPAKHLLTDFGYPECAQIRDLFGPRYVCSPAHCWYSLLNGVAAAILAAAGAAYMRRDEPPAASLMSAGVLALIIAALPHASTGSLQYLRALITALAAAALWFVMLRVGHHLAHPAKGVTYVALIISVAGFIGLGLIGSSQIMPGIFQRLVFDVLAIWLVLFGALLLTGEKHLA